MNARTSLSLLLSALLLAACGNKADLFRPPPEPESRRGTEAPVDAADPAAPQPLPPPGIEADEGAPTQGGAGAGAAATPSQPVQGAAEGEEGDDPSDWESDDDTGDGDGS